MSRREKTREHRRRTPPTRTRTIQTRPGIEPGRQAPARVDVNMKYGESPLTLPNSSTTTTTQEKNDDVCESAKHGARHVEVGGTFCVSMSPRGGRDGKPPRLTLGCKSHLGQILANFCKMTPQL